MDTLFSEQKIGFEFIGNGFALKKTSNKDIIHLYHDGVFVKEHTLYPTIEKRLFVVNMVERHSVTKSKLALSLDISRQSIDNWLNPTCIFLFITSLTTGNSSLVSRRRDYSLLVSF